MRINRGQAPFGVEADHARRDILEQRFGITPAALQFGLRDAQVGRHLIERIDQLADLIVADRIDGVVEIAAGDRVSTLGQLADRTGNAAR